MKLHVWRRFSLLLVLLAGCTDKPQIGAHSLPQQPNRSADTAGMCPVEAIAPGDVRTQQGVAHGTLESVVWDAASYRVTAFKGIPFAAPPVGNLRWKAPQAPECYAGVLHATQWPAQCAQYNSKLDEAVGQEDCLYLNIWRPDSETPSKPVMVFIHGGGNVTGSSSNAIRGVSTYEGSRLAARSDAIVVTLQYRLNVFGFALSDELDRESSTGTSGNYGFLDQIAALKWIQDNISQFGGDPNRVLLFGESGGATDVCAHVASPLSAGLFSAAVAQSGTCDGHERDDVRKWTQATFAKTTCADAPNRLACLRSLTAEALADAVGTITSKRPPIGPTIGDTALPASPITMFTRGERNPVPFVMGSNEHETASPFFALPKILPARGYEALIRDRFDAKSADAILRLYPVNQYDSAADALVALTSDWSFTCPHRRTLRALAGGSSAPVYRYYYTQTLKNSFLTRGKGAPHGWELLFIFQSMHAFRYTPDATDLALQDVFLDAWVGLAREGDPNAGPLKLTKWPKYDPKTDPYIELGAPVQTREGLHTAQCDVLDTLALKSSQ